MLRPALFACLSAALLGQGPAQGTFKLVSGSDLTKGIDQVTEDLPMLERVYAQHRLASVNPLYKTITLTNAACGLELKFDERTPMCLKEGQDISWTREDGELFSVGLQSKDPRHFTQVYKGKEGQRTNTYYVSPGGQILIIDVSVKSHRLKKSLGYHLVYEREK